MAKALHSKRGAYKKAEFLQFARFVALTTEEKKQEFGYYTYVDFAKNKKISRAVLSQWINSDQLWLERDKHLAAIYKAGTSDVLAGVKRRAAHGEKIGAADAMLYLRYVEKWNPKIDLSGSVELVSDGVDFG
jgi:hypothetical protein